LRISSSRDMPMPLSRRLRVRLSRSATMSIASSPPSASSPGSARASKRSFSQASEALDTSSRRKMSLFEYSE
jgi:hypothetical protein